MRWRPAGVAVLGSCALVIGAAPSHAARGSLRSELRLMPLPEAAYGASAAGLTLSDDSGAATAGAAAHNELDKSLTAAKLEQLGRTAGYSVGFDDVTKLSRRGVPVGAGSQVTLFEKPAGAATYAAREVTSVDRIAGKPTEDDEIYDTVSHFAVPGLRGARGVRARIRVGPFTGWTTGVIVPVGRLVAVVDLERTDARDMRGEARRLAVALGRRIGGVLAGRITDKPLPEVRRSLGGVGQPPGSPSLAKMAVSAGDLAGRPKRTQKRFVRNFDYIADYVVDLQGVTLGSTALSSLKSEVRFARSAKTPQEFLWVLRAGFSGARGHAFLRQVLERAVAHDPHGLKLTHLSTAKIAAGDEAWAYTATLAAGAVHVQVWLAAVRRGPVLETLTLAGLPNASVPRLDVERAARIAAARIDIALHN